jgi:hypothetical protein
LFERLTYLIVIWFQSSAEDKLFRSDPILPTTHEIHYNIEPSLRRNLTRGTFKSVDRYLSTHFGLLREDLICSLRNGINEYMHSGGRVRRIKDIKIYRNVSIIQRSDSSLSSYYARLDVQELPPIDWRVRSLNHSFNAFIDSMIVSFIQTVLKASDLRLIAMSFGQQFQDILLRVSRRSTLCRTLS